MTPAVAATAGPPPNTVRLVLRGPNDCTAQPWKLAINAGETVTFLPAPPIAGTIEAKLKGTGVSKLHFPDNTGHDVNSFDAPATTPPAAGSPGDYWHYDVIFTPDQGPVCKVDPEICVQGAGNCKTQNDPDEDHDHDHDHDKAQAAATPH